MKSRNPPKSAAWLFKRFYCGKHSSSLAGDLLEECQQGRNQIWYWRQVIVAIAISHSRTIGLRAWIALLCGAYLLCEAVICVCILGLADHLRHAGTLQDLFSPTYIAAFTLLLAAISLGIYLIGRLRKLRQRRVSIQR